MLVADLSRVFEATQAYVMLSRVQDLKQLIVVIDSVQKDKIYPSEKAMEELQKMNQNVLSSNSSKPSCSMKLVSVNIRSLNKHIEDLIQEPSFLNCDVILVQQTCLKQTEETEKYQIHKYDSHYNSYGDGKGIALYYLQNLNIF